MIRAQNNCWTSGRFGWTLISCSYFKPCTPIYYRDICVLLGNMPLLNFMCNYVWVVSFAAVISFGPSSSQALGRAREELGPKLITAAKETNVWDTNDIFSLVKTSMMSLPMFLTSQRCVVVDKYFTTSYLHVTE